MAGHEGEAGKDVLFTCHLMKLIGIYVHSGLPMPHPLVFMQQVDIPPGGLATVVG